MSTKKKFNELPKIELQKIADYFNLEHGYELFDEDLEDKAYVEEIKEQQYKPENFQYLGVYTLDGIETMVWRVENDDICAIVQPYEDSYTLGMCNCPAQN